MLHKWRCQRVLECSERTLNARDLITACSVAANLLDQSRNLSPAQWLIPALKPDLLTKCHHLWSSLLTLCVHQFCSRQRLQSSRILKVPLLPICSCSSSKQHSLVWTGPRRQIPLSDFWNHKSVYIYEGWWAFPYFHLDCGWNKSRGHEQVLPMMHKYVWTPLLQGICSASSWGRTRPPSKGQRI